MQTIIRTSALVLAAAGAMLTAIPAGAADFRTTAMGRAVAAPMDQAEGGESWSYGDRWGRGDRYERRHRNERYRNDYGRYRGYDQPVYRDTRVWQGRDGQYYCRKKDGTTGLIIGAAAGALLGREVDRYGDRTLGTILGGAAGALLGKEVAGGTRCR